MGLIGKTVWLIALGMGLLFLDFFSKAYVYHLLPFVDSCTGLSCYQIPVFHDLLGVDFAIALTFNRGAAWGIFADFQFMLIILRMLIIAGMFLYLFFFNQNRLIIPPLLLIIVGALGNILDFFLYGYVVDFLSFNLWGYHFPVFNLADTMITIGVAWLFLTAFFTRKKKYAKRLKMD